MRMEDCSTYLPAGVKTKVQNQHKLQRSRPLLGMVSVRDGLLIVVLSNETAARGSKWLVERPQFD